MAKRQPGSVTRLQSGSLGLDSQEAHPIAAGNIRFGVFMLVTLVVFVGILLVVTRTRSTRPSLITVGLITLVLPPIALRMARRTELRQYLLLAFASSPAIHVGFAFHRLARLPSLLLCARADPTRRLRIRYPGTAAFGPRKEHGHRAGTLSVWRLRATASTLGAASRCGFQEIRGKHRPPGARQSSSGAR